MTNQYQSYTQSVQRLQSALHAKAKGSPSFRFYSLCDKVWRADVLAVACQEVRRNGGAPGGWTARRSLASRRTVWTGGLGNWRGT